MANQALTRLRKELIRLQKEPVPLIEATPLDSNILEWHYVLRGPPQSPFEGGYYHGKIKARVRWVHSVTKNSEHVISRVFFFTTH
jgi:ubiquitin-protein ligase